jgi:hypothetical protein
MPLYSRYFVTRDHFIPLRLKIDFQSDVLFCKSFFGGRVLPVWGHGAGGACPSWGHARWGPRPYGGGGTSLRGPRLLGYCHTVTMINVEIQNQNLGVCFGNIFTKIVDGYLLYYIILLISYSI